MVVATKTVKGFGSRYGRKIRTNLAKFAELKNKKKQCPYCHALKVVRVARGIWTCKKCSAKFTGRCYDIVKTKIKEVEDGNLQVLPVQ